MTIFCKTLTPTAGDLSEPDDLLALQVSTHYVLLVGIGLGGAKLSERGRLWREGKLDNGMEMTYLRTGQSCGVRMAGPACFGQRDIREG